MRRNSKSYVLKFIVPLLLLVIISWITFWLSHEEFKTKDQLQSAVATLLIVVAFNITATNLLPRTEYITYIDALLFTCFIFVIISIASIVGTHLLQINYSAQRALVRTPARRRRSPCCVCDRSSWSCSLRSTSQDKVAMLWQDHHGSVRVWWLVRSSKAYTGVHRVVCIPKLRQYRPAVPSNP